MTPGRDDDRGQARLERERFDRRTALRRGLRGGALAALGAGLPGALAACGTTTHAAVRNTWAMHYLGESSYSSMPYDAGGSPPLGDLARLMRARARELRVAPALLPWTQDQAADLRLALTPARSGLDPATGKPYPPGEALVVAGLAHRPAVDPGAAELLAAGVQVVSYLVALERQTAAITVDPARAGDLLATHAAGWARDRLGERGRVLLLRPAPGSPDDVSVNPLGVTGERCEQAMRATLMRLAPGFEIAATTVRDTRESVARALRSHRAARIVLCVDDRAALSAARELPVLRRDDRSRLYVGAVGLPALSSRSTIDVLERDDVLRAVVAARPRDLAEALVDLPRALLRGDTPHDMAVAASVLTPRSSALRAHANDYSRHPGAFFEGAGVGSPAVLNPDAANPID